MKSTTLRYLQLLFWPDGIGAKVGRFFGGLSLFALIALSLDLGLSVTWRVLLDLYDTFVSVLFFWAQPLVPAVSAVLSEMFGQTITPDEGWRHVLVLLVIYIGRDLGYMVRVGLWKTALALAALSLPVEFAVSLLVAHFAQIGSAYGGYLFVASLPVAGILFYEVLNRAALSIFHFRRQTASWRFPTNRMSYFVFQVKNDAARAFALCLVAGIILLLPGITSLSQPGLLVFVLMVIALAFWWMRSGFINTRQNEGLSFFQTIASNEFLSHRNTQVGLGMLSIFLWMAAFVILNGKIFYLGL